jgi:hypothetical protein
MTKPKVVIEVRGGIAYVTYKDKGFEVLIKDWDNHSTDPEECSEEHYRFDEEVR